MHFVKVTRRSVAPASDHPVTISLNGISVSGPLVTLSDGTKTVTSVICTPTHAGQTDPAIITVTPTPPPADDPTGGSRLPDRRLRRVAIAADRHFRGE